MKNKSLFVMAGAVALAAGAVGTSFALYTSFGTEKQVNIGVRTDTDVNYAISAVTKEGNTAMSPDNKTDTYNFDIQGIKQADTAFAQPYVLARLEITITPSTPELGKVITPTAVVEYKSGTHFANTSELNTVNFGTVNNENGVWTGILETYIYTGVSMTTAPNDGGTADHNPVQLNVTLADEVTGETYVNSYAEESYTVDIKVTEATNFEVAYLRGGMNGWEDNDAYEMVANIEASSWEWMWLGTIAEGTEMKAHKTNTWSADDTGDSNPSVNSIAPANMTGAYWAGGGENVLTFSTGV